MELRLYKTKDDQVWGPDDVQECKALRYEPEEAGAPLWEALLDQVTCEITPRTGPANLAVNVNLAGQEPVILAQGDWLVYYDETQGGPGLCVYTDDEFNTLYDLAAGVQPTKATLQAIDEQTG